MSNLRHSRLGRVALAIGLLLLLAGVYGLTTGYQSLGASALCGDTIAGFFNSCGVFTQYPILLGSWAAFIAGFLLTPVSAYYVGLTARPKEPTASA